MNLMHKMEAANGEGAAGGGGDPSCGWSWEENKMFEVALAAVEEGSSERWERVAAMIRGGGKEKSAEEVKRHYEVLLEDLHSIESGRLDRELVAAPVLNEDAASASASCWTDGDQE